MPIISDKIPGPCKALRAGDIMAKDPLTFDTVTKLEEVSKVI